MENVAEAPATESLKITLALDDATRARFTDSMRVVETAKILVVDCQEMAVAAKAELDDIVRRKTAIESGRKGFIAPAMQIIENAKSWFNPPLAALNQAEAIIRAKLIEWTTKEEARIAAENRARVEAERKARQEAEQRAAEERAKAEERQREAREKAAREEQARAKAAAEAEAARQAGDKKAAAEAEARARAAAAEKARQDERERIAREEGERKARELQLKADAEAKARQQAAAAAPAATAGVGGFSTVERWSAELEEGKTEDDAKIAIIAKLAGVTDAVVRENGRLDLLPMLALDMKQANKLAKAQHAHFNVPGLKAVKTTGSMNRKA